MKTVLVFLVLTLSLNAHSYGTLTGYLTYSQLLSAGVWECTYQVSTYAGPRHYKVIINSYSGCPGSYSF